MLGAVDSMSEHYLRINRKKNLRKALFGIVCRNILYKTLKLAKIY